MLPEKLTPSPDTDLFRNRLDNMLDQRHELVRLADPKRVTVDTTVQEKVVAFPTNSRLLNCAGTAGDQMNVMLSCAGHNLRFDPEAAKDFCRRCLGRMRGKWTMSLYGKSVSALLSEAVRWLVSKTTHTMHPISRPAVA